MSSPMWDIPDRTDGLCWACAKNPVGAGLVDLCQACVDELGPPPPVGIVLSLCPLCGAPMEEATWDGPNRRLIHLVPDTTGLLRTPCEGSAGLPDDACRRCGRPVREWRTAGSWTAVTDAVGRTDIDLCPGCFAEIYEQTTGTTNLWAFDPYYTFDDEDPR